MVRPAWTVRVVMLDENLRAQVHLSSIAERIAGITKKGGKRSSRSPVRMSNWS